MQQLFVATYLSSPILEPPAVPSPVAARFIDAAFTGGFPYDVGDDPAFFSASQCNGPVTWGVCRPDVRGALQNGDWVGFFSATHWKEQPTVTNYRFVAALK